MSGGTTHAASAPEPPLMSKTNEEEDGDGGDTKAPLDLIIQVKWMINFSHSTFQAVLGQKRLKCFLQILKIFFIRSVKVSLSVKVFKLYSNWTNGC